MCVTSVATEEINYVVQQPHPLLRAVRPAPLECVSRPLSRTQHTLNGNQLAAVAKVPLCTPPPPTVCAGELLNLLLDPHMLEMLVQQDGYCFVPFAP